MADLALVLVEVGRIDAASAGHGEIRRPTGDVRDLELAPEGAEDEARLAGGVDDVLDIGKAMALLRLVMDRVVGGRRVLDADAVLQVVAAGEVIDAADRPAGNRTGLQRAMAAAVHADIAAAVVGAALGLDIDNPRGPQPVLRRQRTGDEVDGAGETRREALAEEAHALRQDDAVDAELQVRHLVADVELPEGLLRHARRLQHDLAERVVVAAGLALDGRLGDGVGRGADARLDLRTRGVQAPRGDGDRVEGRHRLRRVVRRRCACRRQEERSAETTEGGEKASAPGSTRRSTPASSAHPPAPP